MSPEELHDPTRYSCAWEIDHAAIAIALKPYLWKRSRVMALYLAANAAALGLVALVWFRSGLGFADGFSSLSLGMCLGFAALLPIHEASHSLVYRRLGARSVRVRYNWRALTAYCAADRFVVDKRGFSQVAAAPFVLLNPPLLLLALMTSGAWSLGAAGALLLHVGACSGDFALLNWLSLAEHDIVYSYDDESAHRTFFFTPVP